MGPYVALTLLLCSISYVQSSSYFIMVPKYIRSGYSYNMTVQFESEHEVEVRVLINVTYRSYYTYQDDGQPMPTVQDMTFQVQGGDTSKIDMMIPSLENLPYQKQYLLTVEASASDFSQIVHTHALEYAMKNMTIYVQTDKAKYKPGDLVRFRSFAVNSTLKTIKAPVDVFIYDSMNNKVQQWLGAAPETGLFSEELQLSAQPNMGNWKIEIQQSGTTQTKYFTVEEYVLPKFEVTVKTTPRSYGLFYDDGLRATVTAKYTFGQPVKGSANIQIFLHNYYGCYSPTTTYRYSNRPDCKIVNITTELENGKADIFLSISELVSMIPPNTYAPEGYTGPTVEDLSWKTFRVDVNVTETLTDVVLGSNTDITYRSPSMQIDYLSNSPSTYKPGLSYRGYIQLKNADGSSPIEAVHLTTPSGGEKYVNITAEFSCPYVPVSNPSYPSMPGARPTGPVGSVGPEVGMPTGPVGSVGPEVGMPSTGTSSRGEPGSAGGMPSMEPSGPSSPPTTTPTTTTAPSCVPYVWTQLFPVDNPAGVVTFDFETPQGYEQMNIVANYTSYYGEEIRGYKYVNKFETAENTVAQLSTVVDNGAVSPDTSVYFTLTITEPVSTCSYYVMGKGNLVTSKILPATEPSTTFDFRLDIDAAMAQTLAPSMTVIAVCRTDSNELIGDSVSLTVEGAMINEVGVAFDIDGATNMSRPGDEVDVELTASPESLVGLLVVDQSVLLLQSGNDITTEMVMSDLSQYAPGQYYAMPLMRWAARRKRSSWICWWCYPYYGYGSDIESLLSSANVIVFTDATMYKDEPDYPYYARGERGPAGMPGLAGAAGPAGPAGPGVRGESGAVADSSGSLQPVDSIHYYPPYPAGGMPGAPGPQGPMANAGPMGPSGPSGPSGPVADNSSPLQPVDSIREDFPEAWIWQDTVVGPEGRTVVKATVPDTITSWVASAFALNDRDGLGIAEQSKLTTFKPFFVTLSLPYSIVRGEEFLLKALVFNYLAEDQNVVVTLTYSDEFMVLYNNERVKRTVTKELVVPANDALTAVFWIIPIVIGNIDITVMAQSSQAADALKRTLIVDPEGTPEEYSSSVFLQLTQDEPGPYIRKMEIELPTEGLVSGSEYVKVTAIGDIMGPTANNLASLVRLPSGCGEQNMINFAPNIYVMKYLTAAGLLTSQIESQATSYMRTGYQRELTYKRTDGSYSAFGNYDPEGSTWLTAFVIKCYAQAMPFITIIDNSTIVGSLDFITKQQQPDGSFAEPGRVIHGDLTGGSGSGIGLAAFVLLTLIENRNISDVETVIENTVTYLERELPALEDAYNLAIVSYALKRAGSNQAASALAKLDQLAIDESGYRHWSADPERSAEMEDLPPWQAYSQTSSQDIEMTAYALLAYTEDDNLEKALPIVKWLASKQSGTGAFRSTQDTVVALNALSAFAMWSAATTGGQQNIQLDVNVDNEHHTFDPMTSQNKVVLQSYETSHSAKKVVLKAYGVGTAVVQLIIQYHMEEVDDSASIDLNVDSTTTGNAILLEVCAQWTNEDTDSGMSIVTVLSTSGYVFDTTPLIPAYGPLGLKKVEISGKNLNLYFDEIPSDEELCITVVQYKAEEVANLQPATVSAYSYYAPDKIQKVFYSATGEPVNPCLACIECCQIIDVQLSDDADKYNMGSADGDSGASVTMATSILLLITILLHLV